MSQKNISPKVSGFFRRAMFALSVAFVSGGAVFLVQRGNAESLSGATAFQAADMGAKSVRDEMKKLDEGDPIARLGGRCDDGVISGENSSGNYMVTFRDDSGRPMECSETIGTISAVEVTGIFGSEKRIIRVAVAEATAVDDANNYLTTGAESQYKKGALGIGGLLKAYLGINAGNQRITNVASPEDSSDAVTKAYVDNAIARVSGSGGGGGSPSGSCKYLSMQVDADKFGWYEFREGNGCKECTLTPQNRLCPYYNTCQELSDAGYTCSTIDVTRGEYDGDRTGNTTLLLTCLCYKN